MANYTEDSRTCDNNSVNINTINAHASSAIDHSIVSRPTADWVNNWNAQTHAESTHAYSSQPAKALDPMIFREPPQSGDEQYRDRMSTISTYQSEKTRDWEMDLTCQPTSSQHCKVQDEKDHIEPDAPLPEFMINIGYPHVHDDEPTADPLDRWDGPMEMDIDAAGDLPPPSAVHMVDAEKWPFPHQAVDGRTAYIYDTVKSSGRHNYEGARILLPSALEIPTWIQEATGHTQDDVVIQGIQYGFPIQYCGPPQYTVADTPNHASARCYKEHLDKYIKEESAHGALEGPFKQPPFTPWFVTSPLMTREKAGTQERRIIVDLSFPEGGINKYIIPHVFNGREATHNLPTIESAVNTIATTCPGSVTMAVIDLSRAYRQFPVCPLDWPLLGIKVGEDYFFDRRLPFGARMSSFAMQMAADFIVRALRKRGVKAHMYLDDVVIISPNTQVANRQYDETLRLIESLGLQVAQKKLQPPAPRVTWLGIQFDTENNTLSIPNPKLEEIKRCMAAAAKRTTITKKQLQRIIGVINHLAKVVRAARLFIGRILAAYRATEGEEVKVTHHVKADLKWFSRFLSSANGRAILPHNRTVLRIWADACMNGAGASDGAAYYSYKFPTRVSNSHHITQLEAANCMAAARAFITKAHAGGTVEIHCDNKASVDAFKSGRAKDPVLAACSRALWYKAAETDTTLVFNHVPGEAMELPDALSRVFLDADHRALANDLIAKLALKKADATPDIFSYTAFL